MTTFLGVDTLLRETYRAAEGTMAYVSDTAQLYIRVRDGWRQVQVCVCVWPRSTCVCRAVVDSSKCVSMCVLSKVLYN